MTCTLHLCKTTEAKEGRAIHTGTLVTFSNLLLSGKIWIRKPSLVHSVSRAVSFFLDFTKETHTSFTVFVNEVCAFCCLRRQFHQVILIWHSSVVPSLGNGVILCEMISAVGHWFVAVQGPCWHMIHCIWHQEGKSQVGALLQIRNEYIGNYAIMDSFAHPVASLIQVENTNFLRLTRTAALNILA